MKAVLIPGDGIGPEISASVESITKAMNLDIEWVKYRAGAEYAKETGEVWEPGLVDAIEEYKWALKGPTATPIGTGFRSVNVALRQKFSTYANVRPLRNFKGIDSKYENIDLVIIRENTEDLYKGIEYMLTDDIANGVKLITREASTRICRYAFEYARTNNRKKVTAIHKANIMKYTDGLFLDCYREVAKDYPEIETQEVIIDNMCMQMVMTPEKFDCIVTPNLYGDILSDLAAGLTGGLGLVPGANLSKEVGVFEAVHGSAPDIAGLGIANPIALLLSGCMMLDYLNFYDEANRIRNAVYKTLKEGKVLTRDLGGSATTKEIADEIIKNL